MDTKATSLKSNGKVSSPDGYILSSGRRTLEPVGKMNEPCLYRQPRNDTGFFRLSNERNYS